MTDLNSILADLAAGRIDAAEANRRIEATKGTSVTRAPGRDLDPVQLPPIDAHDVVDEVPLARRRVNGGARAIDRVSVQAVGRRVRIHGDYSVATVAVDGPHVLRRRGSVMEISSDGDVGPTLEGFSILRPPRTLSEFRSMSVGKELLVRVNPGLLVDVEVTAGSLSTEGVPYLGKIRVTGGPATLNGVGEVTDALVQAGSATINGTFRTGRNRVRCESGALRVHLAEDSDVTVTTAAQLGKVLWHPEMTGVEEYALGNGAARLDLSVVIGVLSITVGDGEE